MTNLKREKEKMKWNVLGSECTTHNSRSTKTVDLLDMKIRIRERTNVGEIVESSNKLFNVNTVSQHIAMNIIPQSFFLLLSWNKEEENTKSRKPSLFW